MLKKIIAKSYIYLMLVLIYLPIFVLIVYSFTDSKAIGKWNGFTFDLYTKLFADKKIMTSVYNTLILAVSSSLIATILGTITAVGIFYSHRIAKTALNGVNQITIINAEIVTSVALMLLFRALRDINLEIPKGFPTLIIAHTVITTPYVILAVMPRLYQLNPNLYEAGLDLGASPVRSLLTVITPQLIPSMISGFALAFTLSLDDFVIAKFNKGGIQTISTLIYESARKGINNAFRALSAIIFIAALLILVFINYRTARKKKNVKAGYLK